MTSDLNYDIFISYSRKSSSNLSRIIKDYLLKKNNKLKIFLDVDDCEKMHELEKIIDNVENFILIITSDIFQSDYVCKEINKALKSKKNIITIIDKQECKRFPVKDNFSEHINEILDISAIEFISHDSDYIEVVINKIFDHMIYKKNMIKELKNEITKLNIQKQDYSEIKYINLNLMQKEAFDNIIKGRKNILITGSAGTGKTYLLKCIVKEFNKYDIIYRISSPTGISAINIDGQTLTSLFGIFPESTSDSIMKNIEYNHPRYLMIKNMILELDALLIDEISMVSNEIISNINTICKKIRCSNKPFGGIQIIMFGDFFQLMPVSKDKKYIFEYNIWNELNPKIINLLKSERHENETFNLLQSLRVEKIGSEAIQTLNKLNISKKNMDEEYEKKYKDWIILYGSNKRRNLWNNKMLKKIKSTHYVYKREIEYHDLTYNLYDDTLIKNIPEEIKLKIGARVMLIKNIYFGHIYLVNGDLGYVIDIDKDNNPIIAFDRFPDSPFNISYGYGTWYIYNHFKQKIVTIKQIPLTLGWALTINKSQGLTLNKVIINFDDISFFGQAYTALSRSRSLKTIKIINFDENKIKTNKKCIDFYENIKIEFL